MKQVFARAVSQYGLPLTRAESGETLFAFLQPDGKLQPPLRTAVGVLPQNRWLCLLSDPVTVGERLQQGNLTFLVRETEPVRLGETVVCFRSILAPLEVVSS